MKALYVDVDGVLNNELWANKVLQEDGYDPYDYDELCPANMKNLANIYQATNPYIVISSSWRWDKTALNNLKKEFSYYRIPIHDYTILDPMTTLSREKEIALHLSQHPEITNFCILDDDDNIKTEPFKSHHIKTTLRRGLTREDTIKAIGVLNE